MIKLKETIAMILLVTAFIGGVVACICSLVFNLQHPYMTHMRQMIENPGPIIAVFICLIMYFVGTYMLSHTRKRK